MITKDVPLSSEPQQKNDEDDDADDGTNLLDNDPEKTEKKKKRERIYLEYIIQFQQTNVMNLSLIAMGGLEYKEVDWWIEMETFYVLVLIMKSKGTSSSDRGNQSMPPRQQ